MISIETVLGIYGLLSLIFVLFTIVSKSHKVMNYLAVALAGGFLVLSLSSLALMTLPSYTGDGSYFFMDHLGVYEAIISAAVFLAAIIYAKGYIEGSIKMGEMDKRDVVERQYATSAKLENRISLHEKYSTNKMGWFNWLFSNYDIKQHDSILELGCGNGRLWADHYMCFQKGQD
jgi:hypothetical protein